MRNSLPKITAIILIGFGLLTLVLSTSVIFDLFGVREKEGNYVLFVVWANFISSVIYLFAAYGLLKSKKWTALILSTSVLVLILAYIGLFIHISSGGLYETKTIGAMTFRTILTIVFTLIAYYSIHPKNKLND